jgi:hypothetical protein
MKAAGLPRKREPWKPGWEARRIARGPRNLQMGVSSEERPHQCDGDGSRRGAHVECIHSQAQAMNPE